MSQIRNQEELALFADLADRFLSMWYDLADNFNVEFETTIFQRKLVFFR